MSLKLSSKPKTSHLIDFKAINIVVKFDLSSFTNAINLFFQSILIKKIYQIGGQGLTKSFCCFKQPKSHLFRLLIGPKKLITRTKMSCAPLGIHNSKLVVDFSIFQFW